MGEYNDFLEGELLKTIYKITQQNINFSSGSGGGWYAHGYNIFCCMQDPRSPRAFPAPINHGQNDSTFTEPGMGQPITRTYVNS